MSHIMHTAAEKVVHSVAQPKTESPSAIKVPLLLGQTFVWLIIKWTSTLVLKCRVPGPLHAQLLPPTPRAYKHSQSISIIATVDGTSISTPWVLWIADELKCLAPSQALREPENNTIKCSAHSQALRQVREPGNNTIKCLAPSQALTSLSQDF